MRKLIIILALMTIPAMADDHPILQQWRESLSERKQLIDKATSLGQQHADYQQLVEEKQERIAQTRQKIAHCLYLLLRLGRINPLQWMVDLKSSQQSIRGIILTRTLSNMLSYHIKQVQADVNELQALQADLQGKDSDRKTAQEQVVLQADRLRNTGPQAVEDLRQKEEERLAAETNIHNLLKESDAVLLKKEETPVKKETTGAEMPFHRLEIPVIGDRVDDAALQKKFSPGGKGVLFRTTKGAEVCAAAQGTVVFKGPFKTQGEIVILDHGQQVHTVYMGLDKINIDHAQTVYAGEKIGTMASYGKGGPILYLELRHKGAPIETAAWLDE